MSESIWYWFGVLDQLARENYEGSIGSPAKIFIVATTTTVGMQVVDMIDRATEEFISSLGPSNYYQKNWWLIADEAKKMTMDTLAEHRGHKTHEWPPFTGLRVELGGDKQ